ncbi:MAG: GNAT family N-acetyltransferase [Hyphomicrobiaceae bacterium]
MRFLLDLHTAEDDRRFTEDVILEQSDVSVIKAKGIVVSFLARHEIQVPLLHTHPRWIGRGAGGQLLNHAETHGPGTLELWCFRAKVGARRFYERHGIAAVELTDGARNEAMTPDLRYRWGRSRFAET